MPETNKKKDEKGWMGAFKAAMVQAFKSPRTLQAEADTSKGPSVAEKINFGGKYAEETKKKKKGY